MSGGEAGRSFTRERLGNRVRAVQGATTGLSARRGVCAGFPSAVRRSTVAAMRGRWLIRSASAALAVLTLAACAGGHYRPVADTPVRVGPPYTVRGTTYVPAAAPAYDAVGYASWYGNESGNRTANGEKFRAGWITAAHTARKSTR